MQRICASSYWKGGGYQEDFEDQAVLNQTGISETTPEIPETPGTTSDMIQGISTPGRTRTKTPGDGVGTLIATLTASTLSATNDQGATLRTEDAIQATTKAQVNCHTR
jgi:hypothetical protein